MRKILLYALVIVLAVSLIACNKFTEVQNSNNVSNEQKLQQPPTSVKTRTFKDEDLKGAQFEGLDEQGNKLNFQVRDTELDLQDPEKETYLYTVFYLDKSDKKWKNLCTPDAKNVAKAIPLKGFWDQTGAYIESTNSVTFGCTSGALAKCVRLGYKPWKSVRGKSLLPFHQACTRMIRADYCGNGKSHTREGTPINIYDVLNIQKKDPEEKMFFEAAWGPDGATCINRTRWLETLSEIRKECPAKNTVHINNNGSCKTSQKALQAFPNSLLFNDSLVRKPPS